MSTREIVRLLAIGLGVLLILAISYIGLSRIIKGSGELKITTTPSEARIVLNGREYISPANIAKVSTGKHQILVKKEGYKERIDTVEIVKGKTTEANFWLYTKEVSPSIFKSKIEENQETSSDFEQILPHLPFGNLHFKVESAIEAKKVSIKVTLFAILNHADQMESYKKQLQQYGKEAKDWIKSKGVDSDKLNILWIPEDPFKK